MTYMNAPHPLTEQERMRIILRGHYTAGWLERMRGHLRLSQKDLAAKLRVTPQTIRAWVKHGKAPGYHALRCMMLLWAEADRASDANLAAAMKNEAIEYEGHPPRPEVWDD